MTSVPLLDLTRQHEAIRDEVDAAVREVVDSQAFVLGEPVERLERAVADLHGVEHAVGVASGTDALILPLMALELEPDDEVVVPAFSFFATAGAVHHAGGTPVFADVDPETFALDPERAEAAVTDRTRAILPVHLFGQMAEMEAFRELADARGLFLLEDAAQAVGARRETGDGWRAPGQVGHAATLSFFPTKNLGGWGDGGMVLTDDVELAERMRRLRVHGEADRYHHLEVGTNSRLDALQAAVLEAKLPHLEGWNEARRENARRYHEPLAPLEVAGHLRRPRVDDANEHVFHQYTVRARRRDTLAEHLRERGIGFGVYYPIPLHLQPCFEALGGREGDFPAAEDASREVISLPVFPELTEGELDQVAGAIEGFYGAGG